MVFPPIYFSLFPRYWCRGQLIPFTPAPLPIPSLIPQLDRSAEGQLSSLDMDLEEGMRGAVSIVFDSGGEEIFGAVGISALA